MALFLSTFTNKIDAKGRISVPAPFRAALSAQPFQGVAAYPNFQLPCIDGAGMDHMERIAASTESLDLFSSEQDNLASLIFAETCQLAWDDGGRIVLPDHFIEHAGLKGMAAFVGKGQIFQIWEPEALKAHQAEARKRALENRPSLTLKPQGGAA